MKRPTLLRRLALIAIFAISGALVTFAIAWSTAGFADLDFPPQTHTFVADPRDPDHCVWHFNRLDVLAATSIVVMSRPRGEDTKVGAAPPPNPWWCTLLDDASRSSAATLAAQSDGQFRGTMLRDDAYGFPLSALMCRFDVLRSRVEGGFDITPPRAPGVKSSSVMVFRALPARVLIVGFALDTIFWALLCWLVTLAPFQLRRRLRVRRGACPGCAYLLHGAATCPECGLPSPAPVDSLVTSTTTRAPLPPSPP